jgi:hypothetical protein
MGISGRKLYCGKAGTHVTSEYPAWRNKLGLIEFRSFNNESQYCSNAILSANKYIRKMKGGSQSILVQGNDGKYYVVKMAGNPQGANILANELLGSLIAKSVGLPVSKGKGIHLSDSFIDGHPDLWFELPSGRRRPDKGIHFGSLFVGQPSGQKRPSEYISPSRISTITNRDSFLGMYLLDVWANHQDSRQAILLRKSNDCTQKAYFIDHGHMFGGPEWNFQERPGSALHLETTVYSDLWVDEQIASWISRFQTVIPEVLSTVAPCIPSQWYNGNLGELIRRLADRLPLLAELVQIDAAKSWQLALRKSKDDSLRLSDSDVHNLRTSDTRNSIHRDSAVACA